MPEKSTDQKEKRTGPNSYLKYSSLAFQLLGAIGIFGWLGYKIDAYLGFQFPVFMLLFGFLAFTGMMVQVYRSINNQD
jgi:F0F1-type ATP synthase assembly protein I